MISSRVKFLYLYLTKWTQLESTRVAVLGLKSNCVELVLRSAGDQHLSEAMVIRFWCSSERIETFGGSFFWEMKCRPVCPFSITRVRVDDGTMGSVLYSGGELVGATHGRRQIFKVNKNEGQKKPINGRLRNKTEHWRLNNTDPL